MGRLSFLTVAVAYAQVACGGALGDYLGGKEKNTEEWQMLNYYERWQAGKEGLADYPYLPPRLVKLFERNYGSKPNPIPIPEEPGRMLPAAQSVENSSRWTSPARPGTAISSIYSRLRQNE